MEIKPLIHRGKLHRKSVSPSVVADEDTTNVLHVVNKDKKAVNEKGHSKLQNPNIQYLSIYIT